MNVNMKNPFMLDKTNELEDNSVIIEDGRLDSYATGHSTPKRTKSNQVIPEDPQTQEYRCSPILLTQDTNNEVAWDWQSPKTKIRPKKNYDSSSTPKRNHLTHKKRHSNSPLIYKPSKKRIMKCEDIAKIDQWKNEFLALDARIETVTSHETSRENAEAHDISDEIIFDDFEVEDNNPIIVIEDTPPESSKNTAESSSKVEKIDKESLEDLFDDSINDESMLRCSQEIEEKLSLEPVKKDSSRELTKFGLAQIIPKVPPKPVKSSPSPSTSKFKKYKSDPIDKNPLKNQRSSESDFKVADLFDDDFDIPDDSFDEIVLTLSVDAASYKNSAPKNSILKPETKNSNFGTKSKHFGIENGNHCEKPTRFQPKTSIKLTSVPPQKLGNQKKGTLNGNLCAPSTQASSTNDKKFFRSRNRSDSSFDNNKGRLNSSGVSSGINWSNKGTASSGRGTVSTEIMDIKRTNSCLDRKQSVMSKENSNCSINNFDRLKVNDDGSVDGPSASASRSQNLCTPEEIERKRREAKMKLEAKKRMQNSTKSIKR